MLTTHENRGAQRPAGCEYSAATTPHPSRTVFLLLCEGLTLGTFPNYAASLRHVGYLPAGSYEIRETLPDGAFDLFDASRHVRTFIVKNPESIAL